MRSLVPTLSRVLAQADTHFLEGHFAAARKQYATLMERAQDKADRSTEAVARAMLAWCALKSRDFDTAERLLERVDDLLPNGTMDAESRVRRVRIRLTAELEDRPSAKDSCRAFLAWAEEHDRSEDALDACMLLASWAEVEERVTWLERGLDRADGAPPVMAARAYTELGTALDQIDQPDEALRAYAQALESYRGLGASRALVAAEWAVGASATRLEDWPLAQLRLEAALKGAQKRDDCTDLEVWIRADLATTYASAGDVIEARRQVLQAVQAADEQQLDQLWPERYAVLREQARQLEVEGV